MIEACRILRKQIREVAVPVRELVQKPVEITPEQPPNADVAEMRANAMLAYRHLEDAAMRLGKCIQSLDGGVSVYDK